MVVHSQGDFQPPIATIVSYGLSSFEALLSALDGTLTERSAAVSHLARFRLWAGSLGAHRPSGNRSLAYRLRDASTIKNHVISLLQGLCELVDEETSGEALVPAAQQDVGAEVGDSTDVALEDYFRDGADGHSEISRILDDVGHIVDCLLRLSITIRNPAPHDHFKSRVGTDLVGLYEQWDIKHIHEKFPDALPGLAERLGKATARRRQYFKYREEHVGKLAEGLDAAEVVEGDGGEKATTNASSIPNYLKGSHATDNFAELDAESNISRTSYAPSTASETQLRVPPLPKDYSDGPFQCPYCRMIVSINTRYDWKKHVFRDLRPYVCLSSSCTTPEQQYLRRSDWIEHMNRHHWRTWRCPYGGLCDDFHSARDFEEHVKGKHSSHGPLPFLDALQSLSSHSDLARAKGNCPLCSDFHIMSDKQYISHVAAHLEQLALFGLPNTDAEGEESDDLGSKSNGQGGDRKEDDAESLSSMNSNDIARREWRHPSNIDTEETGEDEGEHTAGDFCTINNLAPDELNTPEQQRQQQARQQQAQRQHQQEQQQQQPQAQDKQSQIIYNSLVQSMGAVAANSWQAQVNIGDRFAKISTLYGSSPPPLFQVQPSSDCCYI
ncbi:hypothetical protein F5144DRAFT_584383 [Chaetomium tenue]|uniref:Uncharacterized protein n=1 Tax=Chaetomium tenue TaxID=1854479 RepID=A0ACB7P1U0_9PEZI|nr:hypothetical protein F5144DRAFT_584383 [Chaetomium globosum]